MLEVSWRDRHGNGPSADTLIDDDNRPIKPFNFHDEQKFKCGSTDQAMYRDFMTGLDGSPMPSFSDNLKPEEAWSLVFYLRTLQPDNTPEKQIAKQLGLTPINPLEPLPSSDSGQQAPSSDQGTNPASQPASNHTIRPHPRSRLRQLHRRARRRHRPTILETNESSVIRRSLNVNESSVENCGNAGCSVAGWWPGDHARTER